MTFGPLAAHWSTIPRDQWPKQCPVSPWVTVFYWASHLGLIGFVAGYAAAALLIASLASCNIDGHCDELEADGCADDYLACVMVSCYDDPSADAGPCGDSNWDICRDTYCACLVEAKCELSCAWDRACRDGNV